MTQTVLAERYQLGALIATGGMGSVYRAVDTHLGRPVAVKVLKRVLADDPTFLERFRREARAAAAISHPGVARVYDYGERSSEAFIVMELVEGDTLAERIARHGLLPWQTAFAIAEQVATALSAAHSQGVVHRDVKPANILLDAAGHVKVTDFGIARAAQATTLTRPGMVLGSANYVAPEQAQGNQAGPAADLYSLGCVLFEAVTGATPYQGPNAVSIATQHVSSPVPDPRERVAELPEAAAALIMRSLGKEPGSRFASASSMAAALAAARSGRDPSAASQASTMALPVTRPAAAPAAMVSPPPAAAGGPAAPTTPAGAAAAAAWARASAHTPPLPWAAPVGGGRAGRAGRAGFGGRQGRAARQGRRPGRQRTIWAVGLALGLAALLALPFVVSRHAGESRSGRPASSAPAPTGRGGNGGTDATARVRVPDVRGERLAVAMATLRALGLEVDVEGGHTGRGLQAVVVATSPGPGSTVDHGSTVRLQVSRRPGKGRGGDSSEEGN